MWKTEKFSPYFFYLLVALLLFFSLGMTGIVRPLRKFSEKQLIVPLRQKVYDFKRNLQKDQDSCRLEGEKQLAELNTIISSLQEENREQKRLLSAPLPKNWQFMTVGVVDQEGEMLVINKGREEGVKEGVIAVTGSTYLGKVSKVSEGMAKVRLATFFDERLSVKIVDGNYNIVGKGLLVGKGLGKMRVEQIFASENVQKGNLVNAGLSGGDLSVGKIEEVVEQKDEAFKSATVEILYDPKKLNTIFLVRGEI